MTRLPPALRPLWPAAKLAHRGATRTMGSATRQLGVGDTPRSGFNRSRDTVGADPQNARLHLAGPAEHLRRTMPIGTPPNHWFFAQALSADVPERFVLDLDDGLVVGEHCAVVTSGGVLDYETGPYFGVSGWKEHPVFLSPRLPPRQRFDGSLAVLACRGSAYNYYHFLLDVLPRWGILRDALPGFQPDAFLANRGLRYQDELLHLAGLDTMPILEPARTITWSAQRLLVPSLPNQHTIAPRWTTEWLRQALPPQNTSDKPRRLYVTRGTTPNTRRMVNDTELTAALERRGFTSFDPGKFSVRDQIDHFAAADVVVAPHGAGLANLVFAPAGVRVLEMFAPRYLNPGYWSIVSNIPDSGYRYLVGSGRAPARGRPMNGIQNDIDIPVDLVMANLDLLLE